MRVSFFALSTFAMLTIAGPVQAKERIGLSLQSNVESFCHLSSDGGELAATNEVGMVRETCNAPYVINAAFQNLASGTIYAGEEQASLSHSGDVNFASSEARRTDRFWRVANAAKIDPTEPIFVRLTISPL